MSPLRGRNRAGLTLAELLVVLTIFGILATSVTRVMVKQQQSYKDASKQASMQRELRLAGSALPAEMRSTSSAGLDIVDMQEGEITFLSNIGSGVTCGYPTSNSFLLPPLLAYELTLTNWYTQPLAGDTVFIYDDGPLSGSEDDLWLRRQITAVTPRPASDCPGAPYTHPTGDAGKTRWLITVGGGPLPATLGLGTVVRFSRPVRYRLYQGTGSDWFMGYQEYITAGWTAIEPVGGPFQAFQAGDGNPSGLQLRYFDSTGVRLTGNSALERQSVSRIDVFLRTNAGLAAVTERRPKDVRDSLMMRVAVRNFK